MMNGGRDGLGGGCEVLAGASDEAVTTVQYIALQCAFASSSWMVRMFSISLEQCWWL